MFLALSSLLAAGLLRICRATVRLSGKPKTVFVVSDNPPEVELTVEGYSAKETLREVAEQLAYTMSAVEVYNYIPLVEKPTYCSALRNTTPGRIPYAAGHNREHRAFAVERQQTSTTRIGYGGR